MKEPFNRTLTGNIPGIGPISGWRLSHFIAFFIAGFLFPQCICLIFILGVAWEVFESFLGNLTQTFVPRGEVSKRVEISTNIMYREGWIEGDVTDIIFNTVGLFFGAWIGMAIRSAVRKIQNYQSHNLHLVDVNLMDLNF